MPLNVYDALKNIDSTSYDWICRVRLQAYWKSFKKVTKELWGINMIFIDDSNTRIHAFASTKFCEKIMPEIKEGDIYVISNFKVKEYVGDETFRPVRNRRHIFFTPHTNFYKDDKGGLQIEKFAFDLFDISESNKLALDNRFLIDMIGKVVNLQELVRRSKNNEEKTYLKFSLSNGSSEINVTFFDNFGEKVEEELLKVNPDNRYIIISCAKISTFEGSPTLTNYPATRVIINPDHYSLNELKKGIAGVVALPESKHVPEPPKKVFTVREIKSFPVQFKEEYVNCEVTVKKFEDKSNWYYRKCTGCNLELNKENGKFKCSGLNGCGRVFPYPDKRFRVCALCSDHTGSLGIIFPDDEISRICGKTVIDIHAECVEEKDEEIFPEILNSFLKKKYIITLQVHEENLKKGSTIFSAKEICQPLGISDNFNTKVQVEVQLEEGSIVNAVEGEHINVQTPDTATSCTTKKRDRSINEPIEYVTQENATKK